MSSIAKIGRANRSARQFVSGYLHRGVGSPYYNQRDAKTGRIERAVAQGGDLRADEFVSYCEALGRKRQMDHIIVSFDKMPNSNIGARVVLNFATALAHYMHPFSPCHVVVHSDGKHHKVHAHIAIANNDESTGRALTNYHTPYSIRRANDEMMQSYGFEQRLEPYSHASEPAWPTRRREFRTRASQGNRQALFSLAMGDAIDRALHDPTTIDMKTFRQALLRTEDPALHLYPISISEHQPAKNGLPGIVYMMRSDAMTSPRGKQRIRSRAAGRLCKDFRMDGIQAVFTFNATRARQRQQTIQETTMTETERLEEDIEIASDFIPETVHQLAVTQSVNEPGHRNMPSRTLDALTIADEGIRGETYRAAIAMQQEQKRLQKTIEEARARYQELTRAGRRPSRFLELLKRQLRSQHPTRIISSLINRVLVKAIDHRAFVKHVEHGKLIYQARGDMWKAEKNRKLIKQVVQEYQQAHVLLKPQLSPEEQLAYLASLIETKPDDDDPQAEKELSIN